MEIKIVIIVMEIKIVIIKKSYHFLTEMSTFLSKNINPSRLYYPR